jgi:hypothetical protein
MSTEHDRISLLQYYSKLHKLRRDFIELVMSEMEGSDK